HKLDFFTYISHEFKTPLSIVIASIEELINSPHKQNKALEYKSMIRKNAFRLLSLINQLMDFRKIENEHSSISLNNGDIVSFVKSISDSFNPLFERENIINEFNSNKDSYVSYFDEDKIEKIISNIISNSYKALGNVGKISISIEINEYAKENKYDNIFISKSDITITIKDNGKGIAPENLTKLFDPFYSGNMKDNFNSGIGLALVNSLVKLLYGEIKADSIVGEGSTFTIKLPLFKKPDDKFISNDSFIDSTTGDNLELMIYENEVPLLKNEEKEKSKSDLLIVEDNKELSKFLKEHFAKSFEVSVVENGKDALIRIKRSHPDIIISDIMMPVMDGNELVKELKSNIETSHIPIILLTAKSGIDSEIEGLEGGADDYMSKPFNLKVLDLKVRNILKSIDSNRRQFENFEAIEESTTDLHNKEAQFISDLTNIVKNNIDKTDFNVNELCKEALISRTQLHMKLKKVTGMSTTEFIKSIKMNEAKKMLLTGNYSISEVSVMVGFNDANYFSKSFKKVFEKSPSEFLKDVLLDKA
ncbi:MAG: response regulator, partial [Bacteroidota bacterium]